MVSAHRLRTLLRVPPSDIGGDGVGQVRQAFLGNEPDLELANGHPAMSAIEVCIHSCAGLQFQRVLLFVQGPDTDERRVQVPDYGLCAPLEDAPQGTALRYRW